MNTLDMIKAFSNAFGPSGFENDVVQLARGFAPGNALLQEDTLRNLYIRRPQDENSAKPVVLLDAHTDEVGFMVQAIRPNGLLQMVALGGWVNSTIPAHRLLIKNSKGQLVPGVVAAKPPHYATAAERDKAPDISQMVVDVGAGSAQEVREIFHIEIGAPMAPDSAFAYNEKTGMMLGKAFDCRVGCAGVLDVMNRIQQEELPVAVVGALASQEEVGTRGAQITARTVKPSVAIVFEGVPADDGFAESWAAQTVPKKGPMLRHIDRTMITNPRFMRFALQTAAQNSIPVQPAVRTGGGTNAAAIHLAGQGIPTVVIGVPVRYAHTHNGYAALQDYEASVRLGLAMLRAITPELIQGL